MGSEPHRDRPLEALIEAAEEAAAALVAEAGAEARRKLEQARHEVDRLMVEREEALVELTEDLFERAAAVALRSGMLLETLETAIADLARRPVTEPLSLPAQPRPAAGTGASGRAGPEEAVLVATQMAIAGRDRPEIEARLRDELGVEDPAAILDGVLEL